ncbi:kinase-like domain-containing protein [Aspergillus coremiiformis]|uniref:non-specific serine/threonine protein kinase n=1 Tax=Aspergillus coremiiformis TaxID=138285 RepID=A0A5N6ZBE4_9EURO|nr:kinase-like domain-containing protein [Aspergillus coremiiformis]
MSGLQIMRRCIMHLLSPLRVQPAQAFFTASVIHPDEIVDEEACPTYNSNPKLFYPAKPGMILADSYQLLVKIGWGVQSTVWLAQDITRYKWQQQQLLAVKIINSNATHDIYHERDIESLIATRNPSHKGYGLIRTYSKSFEVAGPEDNHNHMCMIYKPMREPLWILQKRFTDHKLPLPLAKAYILFLLAGLDYLHTECGIVHTDLKLDNILMTFENENILPTFVQENLSIQYKTNPSTGQVVYRCQNDFGALDWRELKNMFPKITDFGSAVRLDSGEEHTKKIGLHPIQPDQYRAPEVILGHGWDFSADIWNLGVLTWNIIENTELFCHTHDTEGQYSAKAHIAEMIGLLGPPPKKFLARSDTSAYAWPDSITNEAGKPCRSLHEFYGGPFFTHEGRFLHQNLIPTRSLDQALPSLPSNDKDSFISFISSMLTWIPEERKTAHELMEHPFLSLHGQ